LRQLHLSRLSGEEQSDEERLTLTAMLRLFPTSLREVLVQAESPGERNIIREWWNELLSELLLPPRLCSLAFGAQLNQSLAGFVFPPALTHLDLGRMFAP
jgi:hypothetical protein